MHLYLCIYVCVSERSLHIVIQETHMVTCDLDVRHSSLGAAHQAGASPTPGCKCVSAAQRRQACLGASGRYCVVSSLESRRILLKLPCGLIAHSCSSRQDYQHEKKNGK